MPAEFWERPAFAEAFAARHFGRVLYAYRYEHRPVLTQAKIGRLLGVSQAQVSRLEREAQPARDLDKLVEWAQILRIPQKHLWFRLLDDRPDPSTIQSPASIGSFG